MTEAAQLRQILAAVMIETERPIRLHLSSLHMAQGRTLRVKHNIDAATLEITFADEEERSDAQATGRTDESSAGGKEDPGSSEQT